jgi:hypothetical protein
LKNVLVDQKKKRKRKYNRKKLKSSTGQNKGGEIIFGTKLYKRLGKMLVQQESNIK